MSITKVKCGMCNDKEVFSFFLDNNNGLCAEILNYGCIIKKLIFNGTDVVLGFDNPDEFLKHSSAFGAVIGRVANRIANACFEIDGQEYKLTANSGKNSIHGGVIGFNKMVWDAKYEDGDEPKVIFSRLSPDGEEGFPGNLFTKVTYTLTRDNAIKIHYEAETDADTIINLTNHAYFNLNGHNDGSVENHKLWISSNFFTPNFDDLVPNGQILSSKGTSFDFTAESTISENMKKEHEQIKKFGTFDHNFVLDKTGYRLAAIATGDKSGIKMEMYTDCPGVQLYVPPREFPEGWLYKDNAHYVPYNSFCLETQGFPNSINYSHFPSVILRKGDKHDTTTTFKFK